jgi:hypothetical protein
MEKLLPEISYTIGEFNIFLNKTGELKVVTHTLDLKITPKSDNSIIINACK